MSSPAFPILSSLSNLCQTLNPGDAASNPKILHQSNGPRASKET